MGNDNSQSAPSKGFCASRQMYYYENKLHAINGISGVIHSYDMTAANVHDIHYLDDAKRDYHDRLMLGDKGYLSADVQQDLFETARIKLEVPCRLNQKNWRETSWAYRRFRKRIETVFSQLNDQFMMVRNYARRTCGLFTRTTAKIGAMTVLQYVNGYNHRGADILNNVYLNSANGYVMSVWLKVQQGLLLASVLVLVLVESEALAIKVLGRSGISAITSEMVWTATVVIPILLSLFPYI